jgi:NADPH:quinone reductase-like Zn-dependent oxidoreductase
MLALNAFVPQRLRPLPDAWTREHLLTVTELVEAEKLTPVVGRTYPLADTAAGLRHLEEGHARGKVVITVT